MTAWVWIALIPVGAAGAVLRYLTDTSVAARTAASFPYGTLVVNTVGSFVAGGVAGLVLYHALPATPKDLLATGFCGAYTTFSTLNVETLTLAREGTSRAALVNFTANMAAAGGAAALGIVLASM